MPLPWTRSEVSGTPSLGSETSSPPTRTHRPFSSFFHGESVINGFGVVNQQERAQSHHKHTRTVDTSTPPMRGHSPGAHPALRSPTSTRSIIDPSASPANSVRQLSPAATSASAARSPFSFVDQLTHARVIDHGGNVPLSQVSPTQRQAPFRFPSGRTQRSTGPRSQRQQSSRSDRSTNSNRPRWIPRHAPGKVWFPSLQSSAVRGKFLHVLVSGFILAVVLIIFIVLAASQPNSDFFANVRIFFVLLFIVFGVLFAHSILRMMMLVHRFRKHGPDLGERRRRLSRESFAHINSPIHVILARDEELGIGGSNSNSSSETSSVVGGSAENTEAKGSLPPPPPVYGVWRGSVRVDPNLLHWQRVEAAREPHLRPVSEASTIHRPPSYTPMTEQLATMEEVKSETGEPVTTAEHRAEHF